MIFLLQSDLRIKIIKTWFTCVSKHGHSGETSLFLLYVNKFQNGLHRMDATKHTLPTIQRSLSCKKFSMATTFTPNRPVHVYDLHLFFLKLFRLVVYLAPSISIRLSVSFNPSPLVDISTAGELQITKGGQIEWSLVREREHPPLHPLIHKRMKTSASQQDERLTGGSLATRQRRPVSRTRCIL